MATKKLAPKVEEEKKVTPKRGKKAEEKVTPAPAKEAPAKATPAKETPAKKLAPKAEPKATPAVGKEVKKSAPAPKSSPKEDAPKKEEKKVAPQKAEPKKEEKAEPAVGKKGKPAPLTEEQASKMFPDSFNSGNYVYKRFEYKKLDDLVKMLKQPKNYGRIHLFLNEQIYDNSVTNAVLMYINGHTAFFVDMTNSKANTFESVLRVPIEQLNGSHILHLNTDQTEVAFYIRMDKEEVEGKE